MNPTEPQPFGSDDHAQNGEDPQLTQKLRDLLRAVLSEVVYRTWAVPLRVVIDEDGSWQLPVPDEFTLQMASARLGDAIEGAASTLGQPKDRIKFVVDPRVASDWQVPKEPVPSTTKTNLAGVQDATPSQVAPERPRRSSLSEVNFIRLPFAVLWDKEKRQKIEIEQRIQQNGVEVTRRWRVEGGSELGIPGPGARATFRALEKIFLERTIRQGKPLTNPQEFDTLQVLRELRLVKAGRNTELVQRHLLQLKATTIIDQGMIRDKPEGGRVRGLEKGDSFNLIERVLWCGELLPDGTRTTHNLIWLGQRYVDSVNSGYVKPLDWDLWLSLGRLPLAQRLYEVLGLDFYGLKDSPYVAYDYWEWCCLMPVRPQKYLSKAQLCAKKAHDLLKAHGILREVEWDEGGGQWRLLYYPTKAYLEQIQARRSPEWDPLAVELAKEFDDMKSLALYQRIVDHVDWQYIQAARTETRMKRSAGGLENPGAYFIEALKRILKARGLSLPFGS